MFSIFDFVFKIIFFFNRWMYQQHRKEARQAETEKNAGNGLYKDKTIMIETTKESQLDTTVVENGKEIQGVVNDAYEK